MSRVTLSRVSRVGRRAHDCKTRTTARLGGRTPIESTLFIAQLLLDQTCGLWKRWRHVGRTVTHELRVSESVRDSRLRVPAPAPALLSLKSSSLTDFTTT